MNPPDGFAHGRIGVGLAAFGELPVPDALERAAALGVDLVDLQLDSVLHPGSSECSSTELVDLLKPSLERLELGVASVSNVRDAQLLLGPHGDQTDLVTTGNAAQKRSHAARYIERTIEVADALGAADVRLYFGVPDFSRWLSWPGSTASWHDCVAEFLDRAAPYLREATTRMLRICVEPHPRQIAYDASSYLDAADSARQLGYALGLCFDPSNIAALGHDPVSFLASVDTVPAIVHVKDVEVWTDAGVPVGPGWVRYGPQPPVRFRSFGWGALDWRAIFSALAARGFSGPLVIEHEDVLLPREVGVADARAGIMAAAAMSRQTRVWSDGSET